MLALPHHADVLQDATVVEKGERAMSAECVHLYMDGWMDVQMDTSYHNV